MTVYANTLSTEDTYVTLSGEHLTVEEEHAFLTDELHNIEAGEGVLLECFVEGNLVGICGISRNQRGRKRSHHLGIFGISIHKDYRGQGLGSELAKTTIKEAILNIQGLRIITLSVYKPNKQAHDLYTKLGFVDYGMLPEGTFYKDGYIDKILMYKKIT
jgi:RimJ/RimL family protein N-acetyltransferase